MLFQIMIRLLSRQGAKGSPPATNKPSSGSASPDLVVADAFEVKSVWPRTTFAGVLVLVGSLFQMSPRLLPKSFMKRSLPSAAVAVGESKDVLVSPKTRFEKFVWPSTNLADAPLFFGIFLKPRTRALLLSGM